MFQDYRFAAPLLFFWENSPANRIGVIPSPAHRPGLGEGACGDSTTLVKVGVGSGELEGSPVRTDHAVCLGDEGVTGFCDSCAGGCWCCMLGLFLDCLVGADGDDCDAGCGVISATLISADVLLPSVDVLLPSADVLPPTPAQTSKSFFLS